MTSKTPKYTNHNGYLMPYGFPKDNFASSLSYAPEPNDLFVATYPKNGTTLTMHIVYLLLNDGIPVQKDEKLDRLFPHLEETGAEYVKNFASKKSNFRLIKTHLPYNMVKNHPKAKYIFIARNAKDCVVSFFHHTRGFPKHYDFEDGDFEVYFDLFLKGQVDFGDYFEFIRSWFDHRHDNNVLFLTYEQIVSYKEEAILQIARFISDDLVDKVMQNNGELMKKILLHSSVENMKKEPLRWSSERKSKFTPFIRRGESGSWNELLSDDKVQLLDRKFRERFNSEEVEEFGDKY